MLRPKTPVDSFRFALHGVLLSFKTQRHLRIHFGLAFLALVAGFVWGLSRLELLVLIGAITLVILAELFNTALEAVVDLVTLEYHPLAKVAKDVAAGAVLVSAVNAALVGALLFLDAEHIRLRLQSPQPQVDTVQAFVVGLVMLLILLVIWKVNGGKGRFLQGGVVSGHTAIAFFLSASVLFLSPNQILVALFSLLLALLVAQSRVEAGIHTLREVLYGALLGLLIPMILYRLIPTLLQLLAAPAAAPGLAR
ncbi:MAG: diacylglycerol kinase [Actinomycetota bacterium]